MNHAISCPFPEGCDCGASTYNALHAKHDTIKEQRDALVKAARALLKVPEVRKAAANWGSDEMIALHTELNRYP